MSQINVNTITGKDGGSAVNFPNGITVTGVITATQLTQNVTGDITASGTVTGGAFSGPLTGNVTGTASLASNLTGTPNITVGTVGCGNVTSSGNISATDATFSGNLTVNGTTTTIDTAVTAVDSLAVDGNITSLGKIGIGTENPAQTLVVNSGGTANGVSLDTTYSGGPNIAFKVNGSIKSYIGAGGGFSQNGGGDDLAFRATDNLLFDINGVEAVRIDQNRTTKFKGPLTEKCNRDTGAGLTGDYNHDLISYGNVHWSTSNSSGTWTYNLRGSGTVAVNDMMADGETLSFQLISAQNSTSNYMTAFKIDGSSSHLVFWQGGSAPSEGGSSGYDVYTFTIFKIANASFRIFAALSNHA